MRILLRVLSFSVLLGLSTAVLAQSSPSGNNTLGPDAEVVQQSQNSNNGNQPSGVSLIGATGQSGSQQAPLTQDEISQVNQTITKLQNQLQQINDPNDPRAIKLQETIDRYQDLLNNQ